MITVGECYCGRIGTLDNGRCVACRLDAAIDATAPRTARYAVREIAANYCQPWNRKLTGTTFAVVDFSTSTAHKGGNSWTIEGTCPTRAEAEALAAKLNAPAPRTLPLPLAGLTVAELMGALVAELEADEVIDPLAQSFTLAGIWSDLARLAHEPLPPVAAAVLGDVLDSTPADLRYLRGAAADEFRTWPESKAAAYFPAD